VSYFSHPIDISHDVWSQYFSALNELVKDAKTENGVSSLSWLHWIYVSLNVHVLTNDSSTSLTKTQGKKWTDFDDSFFKCLRLILDLNFLLFLIFV